MEYYYEYFKEQLEKYINAGKIRPEGNVVIYPFGKQGMTVKQILNWQYGIKEAFICDNGCSKINPQSNSLAFLAQINTSKYCFLITSDHLGYWDEIRDNLRKYVAEENILDLFSCKPLTYHEPRIASLEIASREIYHKKIAGAVAEAGVYRGDFSAYINQFFYDRKLYLFDTFEGFHANDIEVEKEKSFSLRKEGFFGDTSIDIVLSKMTFRDNVIIKKGFFPETTEGIQEKFCFVNLDMDLYQPIKAGLEYFYPRLCGGGVYIYP